MKQLSVFLPLVATIDGWLSSHEGYFLYKAASKVQKGNIVEIGSWLGKSTICLASGARQGVRVTAVDPHKGEYTKDNGIGKKSPTYKAFLKNLSKAGIRRKVTPFVATSQQAAKTWKGSIQFLFIDGLHDYTHTHQDFRLWSPYIAKGGVIAFHDAFCGHIGPEKVILKEILPNEEYSDFGVVGSIIYARKKKATTLFEKLNRWRNVRGITLALHLNKSSFPFRFFLIHRILKLLLVNTYTRSLLLKR